MIKTLLVRRNTQRKLVLSPTLYCCKIQMVKKRLPESFILIETQQTVCVERNFKESVNCSLREYAVYPQVTLLSNWNLKKKKEEKKQKKKLLATFLPLGLNMSN